MTGPVDEHLVPAPPAELADHLRTVTVDAGATLYRIHASTYVPDAFNPHQDEPPQGGRFDHGPEPDPPTWAHLYAADTPAGAICETLLRLHITVPAPHPRALTKIELQNRNISTITTTRELSLAQLRDGGLPALGIDANLTNAPPRYYGHSRAWARAVHDATNVDGISYRSRHDNNQICTVLFSDRAADAVTPGVSHPLDSEDGWGLIAGPLDGYNIAFPFPT